MKLRERSAVRVERQHPALLAFAVLIGQQGPPDFAPASPESQGIPTERLAELGAVVQGYVDAGKVVGAELLVIRHDRTVWHRGYGWKQREEAVPMEPGGVFCLRSMTKAVVGAAVQMLIDEEELAPADPVARYLPSFDNERSRTVEVQHLLTHTSGLPLSSLIGTKLAGLAGERDVAALAGARGPDFAPGTRYQYSDDGADTLGALIEVVSRRRLEDFLEERLLEPLGMVDTACVMSPDHPLRAKVCSHYAGGPGAWERYWSPADPPLFGFLLGSQGLYGSALDYARFLRLFRDGGRAGGRQILSARAVSRALAPLSDARMPSALEGLEVRYGQMMMLWVDPAKEEALVAFGHGGSEGTIAWVFPALDLMVLYFTQSRNGTTPLEIGAAVQRSLLDPLSGAERARPVAYSSVELDMFTGLYWEEDDQESQAILRRGEALFVEFPGKGVYELEPTRERDAFQLALSSAHRLEFERDEQGTVVAFVGVARGKKERMPRLVPRPELPSVTQLLERKRSASDWTRIESLGAVRMQGVLDMPLLGLAADLVILADGLALYRSETDYGSSREATLVQDGRAWSWSPGAGLEELQGARRAQAELEHPFLPVADWRALYRELAVLARVRFEGTPALVLRATPREGNAHTWLVGEESGLPLALLTIDAVPGMGAVGSITRYADWRTLGGFVLPFRSTIQFASPLLGTAEVRWDEVAREGSLSGAAFDPATLAEVRR